MYPERPRFGATPFSAVVPAVVAALDALDGLSAFSG